MNPDGIELSGGEAQKLMMARALYKDAPVLVLDEPTAALDPIAENEVYEQYRRMAAGKTSLFISHRLASTRFCDRIVLLRALFSMDDGFGFYFLRRGMLTAGYAAYVVLHELVHGVCMKYFSGAPVRYGFTGLYAYARSEAYFTKKRYFIIALAPVAVWGVVLLALCMLVPAPWFWTVYLIQIGNIAGAAGDFYVVWRFAAMPPDILVRDAGVDMTVYSRGRKVQAQ